MRKLERLSGLVATALLGACSLAPAYKPPVVPVATQFQSAGPWTVAAPADYLPREGWWTLYGDARLDQLEQQLLQHNPDLAAAWDSYRQSQDYLAETKAGLFPQVGVGGSATRNRQSNTAPLRSPVAPADYNDFSLGAQANYEVDLWGSVRDSVAASRARTQASADQFASVRLSLETELADSYVALIGVDRQLDLLQTTVAAYERAVKLTSVLYNGGAVSGLDVDRAQTQLASTRSQLLQTRAQRDLLQHAIAALVGQSASSFALSPQTTLPTLPVVPVSVPSTLLQRRPDIAAAERLVAADNAQIGVARAAFFPSLTLSAGGGVVSSSFDNLLSAPNRVWSLGPSMLLNVVDGGQRRAALRGAHAATDEAAEHYRSVALAAFQQVEDQQSRLADFGSALVEQNDAVTAADRTLKLSMGLYKQGADDYLDVVTAQVASLQAHLSLLGLQTDQLRASIQLVRALGGGWQDTSARRG